MDNNKPAVMISMDMVIEKYTNLNESRINLIPRRHSRDSIQDIIYEYIDRYPNIPRSDSEILTYMDNHMEELIKRSVLTANNLDFYKTISSAVRSYAVEQMCMTLDGEIYNAAIKALTAQYFEDCKVYTVPAEIWKEVLVIAQDYELDESLSYLEFEILGAIGERIEVVND